MEKCYNLKSSENITVDLDAGVNQLTNIVDAELCWQQQNDSRVERPKTPKNVKAKQILKYCQTKGRNIHIRKDWERKQI